VGIAYNFNDLFMLCIGLSLAKLNLQSFHRLSSASKVTARIIKHYKVPQDRTLLVDWYFIKI